MKQFDKPLNEWIEEEVTVKEIIPELNEKENRVEFKAQDVKRKQKTMYVDPVATRVMCAVGDHNWYCLDKHKYVFACTKCSYQRKVYPVTYDFIDGKLIHRDSGRSI